MRYQTALCPAKEPTRRPERAARPHPARTGRAILRSTPGPVKPPDRAQARACENSRLSAVLRPPGDPFVTAKILDGKAIAQALKAKVRSATDALAAGGARRPGLAVVLVGQDPASEIY